MFENLQKDSEIADETDRLGGGMPDSGLYDTAIEMAYVEESQGGALGLILSLATSDGRNIRNTLWMTSGVKKGKKNFYIDRNGNKQYLPGYLVAASLTQLAAGEELASIVPEAREIPVYDFDLKKETLQSKQVLTSLIGKKIAVGVIKETVNKNVKNAEGVYVPTAETRDQLVIDKFFEHGTGCTTVEKKAGLSKGEFAEKWAAKNTGTVKDRTVSVAGDPGVASAADAGQATSSLFS